MGGKKKDTPPKKGCRHHLNQFVKVIAIAIAGIIALALFTNPDNKKEKSGSQAERTQQAIAYLTATAVTWTPSPTVIPTATWTPTSTYLPSEMVQTWYLITDAKFYACPSTDCAIVFEAVAGNAIRPVETTGGWHKMVNVKDEIVYVQESLTSLTPPATKTPTLAPTSKAPTGPTAIPITVQPETLYATGNANLRPCPRTTTECAAVDTVHFDDELTATGHVAGENVGGNALWYQVSYAGQALYVHSSVVSMTRPATAVPAVQQPAAQPATSIPAASGFDCSQYGTIHNCDEARQTGLSGAQIAQCWPGLDRNHNGEACRGT